jgi:predicted peptidase
MMKGQISNLFEKKVFTEKNNGKLNYRFYRPDHLDQGRKYPLVIFLHGSGERGDDNEKQLANGINLFSDSISQSEFACYILAPQCPEKQRWVEVDWKLPNHIQPVEPSKPFYLLNKLIDSLTKEPGIDKLRIYITGLSMGGFGVWDLITRFPEKFAAAIPICGGGDETKALQIKDVPVWAFHGATDKAVMVERSRNMVEAVRKTGGNIRYTEYPQIGHACWNEAYAEKGLLEWLFSQKKK